MNKIVIVMFCTLFCVSYTVSLSTSAATSIYQPQGKAQAGGGTIYCAMTHGEVPFYTLSFSEFSGAQVNTTGPDVGIVISKNRSKFDTKGFGQESELRKLKLLATNDVVNQSCHFSDPKMRPFSWSKATYITN